VSAGRWFRAEHGNFIVNDGNATARDILEVDRDLKQHAER